jgi:hypothetical protein
LEIITEDISTKMASMRELEFGLLNMGFIMENGILANVMVSSFKKMKVVVLGI